MSTGCHTGTKHLPTISHMIPDWLVHLPTTPKPYKFAKLTLSDPFKPSSGF